jgi:hypothetical protein
MAGCMSQSQRGPASSQPRPSQARVCPALRRCRAGQRQHGDLAEGVEAPEIDQDDVDHVMAAAAGDAVFQEIRRRSGVARASAPPRPAPTPPGPPAPPAWPSRHARPPDSAGVCLRQEIQRQQQQNHRDHLDRKLGQCQIGAENLTKISDTSSPTAPIRISATKRWRCSQVARAPPPPWPARARLTPSTGNSGRGRSGANPWREPAVGAQHQRRDDEQRDHALQRAGVQPAGQAMREGEQPVQKRL